MLLLKDPQEITDSALGKILFYSVQYRQDKTMIYFQVNPTNLVFEGFLIRLDLIKIVV